MRVRYFMPASLREVCSLSSQSVLTYYNAVHISTTAVSPLVSGGGPLSECSLSHLQ